MSQQYPGRELEVLANLENYYDWIVHEFAPFVSGDVLEVGSGAGAISRRIKPLADSLTLLEPSPNLVELLREQFDDPIIPSTFEEYDLSAKDGDFDTIVTVNVVEHIEDDVKALRGFHRVLRPGGALCVFVPALPFLYSEFDAQVGHFRRYTKRSLTRTARIAGFTNIEARYFDLPGVAAWLLTVKLMKSTTFNPAMVQLFDKYVVPPTRAIETRFPPLLGKNLILTARR
ncbi:MAG: SAM-dependent methyltransferase [Bradymonadia bacterium]|jgi:SAM-dependent methyltransferase